MFCKQFPYIFLIYHIPYVLQTVRRRLLHILVLGPDQLEEVGDNLEMGGLNQMYLYMYVLII